MTDNRSLSPDWGGSRDGAGRPKIGSSRTVRITLPDQYWERIDEEIERGTVNKQAEFFRLLCELQFEPKGSVIKK